MNFKTELKAMRERMFTPELLEEIVAACQLEPEEYELLQEPLEERDALLSVLDGKQRTALLKAERLYAENNAYALRFAFPQGVYAGFEQFFAREGAENPFDAYVVHQILTTPNMGRHIDYFERKNQINACFAKAERELDVDTMGHVIDLYCAWDHRLYGVLRHGFRHRQRRPFRQQRQNDWENPADGARAGLPPDLGRTGGGHAQQGRPAERGMSA